MMLGVRILNGYVKEARGESVGRVNNVLCVCLSEVSMSKRGLVVLRVYKDFNECA